MNCCAFEIIQSWVKVVPWLPSVLWLAMLMVIWILTLLLCVAYLTYAERKIIAAMQLRKGPNTVGPLGLLQPIADGVKLLHKEIIVPSGAHKLLFFFAPLITFTLSLAAWAVIPFDQGIVFSDINVGVLYLLAVSSLGVYGIIIAGWASNSRYAFLGAMRSAAQMISYEISIGLVLITVLLSAGTMNLTLLVESQKNMWYVVPHFPMFIIFVISALAETNRSPFDLPEAEAELVAGYNVEYSSMNFSLFFLGEYANMILMSTMASVLFLGGWLPPFDLKIFHYVPGPLWMGVKVIFILFIFIWVRATFPRYRYDQLMRLGWKVFLPFSFTWMILTSFVLKWLELRVYIEEGSLF